MNVFGRVGLFYALSVHKNSSMFGSSFPRRFGGASDDIQLGGSLVYREAVTHVFPALKPPPRGGDFLPQGISMKMNRSPAKEYYGLGRPLIATMRP